MRDAGRLGRVGCGIVAGGMIWAAVGCAGSGPAGGRPADQAAVATRSDPSPPVPAASRPAPHVRADAPQLTAAIGEWQSLFDGRTLAGWKVLSEGPFDKHGSVTVADGVIQLGRGNRQTGVSWTGAFPREEYEVSVEAMRVDGSDFFCGMTFPVGDEPCTLIIGGWGGSVVGLSNVDGDHAAENVTTSGKNFENDRWYRIRLSVTSEKIEAWIDDESYIDLPRANRAFSVWYEQEPVRPFGVSTWDTGSSLRAIRVRRLR